MKRTTVKLPDELDARLRHEAARRGITVSELTREAIATYLDVRPRRKFLAAAAGRSGQTDLSVRIEEILRDEWGHPDR
jgi:predicted transcriptional regulator